MFENDMGGSVWSVIIGAAPTLAFGDRAVAVLKPVFESVGQLLPLKHQRKELAVVNVTYEVDCIDDRRAVRDPDIPSIVDLPDKDSNLVPSG